MRSLLKSDAQPGDKVGHFEVKDIENDIVTIGCHKFNINEAKLVLNDYLEA